jgi:hypothetical protein
MIPFLPVLYGNIIQNREITDRFLFDFKMTMSDLIIEGHYLNARKLLNKYGLKLCSEAGGPGQPLHNCPFEALRALGSVTGHVHLPVQDSGAGKSRREDHIV